MNRPLPSLSTIAEQTLARLSRQTLVFAATVLLLAALSMTAFVLRPAYKKFGQLQQDTARALSSRNQELVKASVEQAAGNIMRVLGAAENAVTTLRSTLAQAPHLSSGRIPLEPEFFPGGKYASSLQNLPGYDTPVTFKYPQLKTTAAADQKLLAEYWRPFSDAAETLHSYHPELKWLYLGTPNGGFFVFPSSPAIPKVYDPRQRDWYKDALAKRGPVWGSPYYTAGGNDLVLTVSEPVTGNPRFKNTVVGVDVVMADIINNLLTTPFCDKCSFYLVDNHGKVLGQRGETTQGPSWTNAPTAPVFRAELAQLMPSAKADEIARATLRPAARTQFEPLSRFPKAAAVDTAGLGFSVFYAPISNLGWSLVGVVPKDYPGADGLRVISGVSSLIGEAKASFALLFFVLALFVSLLIYAVFQFARSSIQRTMSPSIAQFSALAKNLEHTSALESPEVVRSQLAPERGLTQEYRAVAESLSKAQESLFRETREKQRLAVQAGLGDLAADVAHNIRNPLSSMLGAVNSLSGAGPSIANPVDVLRSGIDRVQSIVGKLLRQYQGATSVSGTAAYAGPRLTLVDKAIHDVVVEHRVNLPSNLELGEDGFSAIPGVWGVIQIAEIQSAVSNIIQNAKEAIDRESSGIITVSFSTTDSRIRLSVSDNGKGIAPELLPRVFDRDFTHDKPGGTGIGLHQAKKTIEWHEGSIHIESVPGNGTTLTIELRQEATPEWLGETITVPIGFRLCFFDDDPSMLSFWKSRMANHPGISVSYCPAIRDLATAPLKDSILVVDHYFRDERATGLDVLEGLDVLPPTYLCTTAYDDPEIQSRAMKLGIRIIPKPLIQAVSFLFLKVSQTSDAPIKNAES